MTSNPVREALQMIQSGLECLRHSPGPIDGHWGAQTRGALERLLAADGRAAPAPATPPPYAAKACPGFHVPSWLAATHRS